MAHEDGEGGRLVLPPSLSPSLSLSLSLLLPLSLQSRLYCPCIVPTKLSLIEGGGLWTLFSAPLCLCMCVCVGV